MARKLSTMHGNKRVFIERTTLNLLYIKLKPDDPRFEVVSKVLERIINIEVKTNEPYMHIPVRVSELKKIYPNYLEKEPCWYT